MSATLNAQDVWTAEDIIFFRQKRTHGLVTEAWLSLCREDIQVETSDSVLAWVECGKIQQCMGSYPRSPWGLVLLCSCQRRGADVTHSMGKQPRVEEQNTCYSNHHISSITQEYISIHSDSPIISSVPHLVYCIRIYKTRKRSSAGGCRWERTCLPQPGACAHKRSISTLTL